MTKQITVCFECLRFRLSFECEQPNDLCMTKLPFGCSEIFTLFLLRRAEWQFDQTFQNKKYLDF